MNDKVGRELLTSLIDKYERSSFYQAGTKPTRRILLKLYDSGQSDYPQYDIERSDRRILINDAVLVLAEKGLISFEWMKGEDDHFIAKVWLNYEQLDAVYEYVGRRSKSDMVKRVCTDIASLLRTIHLPWAQKYLQDLYETISMKRSLGNRLPEDEQERENLFRAIKYIDAIGDHELLERVFSIQCFGDSKQFERTVRPRLLGILRKHLETDEDTRDDDMLRRIGIVKYPEQFEFCGNAALIFKEGIQVDFSALKSGSCISLPDLINGKLVFSKQVKSVISIENKANYVDYITKQRSCCEFVLFHGGQYSASKGKFLRAVAQAASDLKWFHWGDIDYGGFSMLARLRREISPDVTPYHMDRLDLLNYDNLTASTTPVYDEKLKRLLLLPELEDCYLTIKFMMERHVKLEQEAMLTALDEMRLDNK